MQTSITFSGELDERAIDREVDALNRRLQEAGNIEINTVGGPGGVGGMGGGVGGGMAGGDGMGLSDIAEGVGGLQGALEARMPKAIGSAGGMAAKAAPVALAGAVGVGMLSAMHSASASLQTSASILGNSWNRVWRPIGKEVDQLFVRDAVEEVSEATRQFESTMRSEGLAVAAGELTATLAGDAVSGIGNAIQNSIEGQLSRGPVGQFQSLAGPLGEFGPGLFVGGVAGATGRSPGQVRDAIGQIPSILQNAVSDFSWPKEALRWPGWPNDALNWPGWPQGALSWPGWPQGALSWPGWPTEATQLPGDFWPDIGAVDVLGTVFPAVRAGQIVNEVFGSVDIGFGNDRDASGSNPMIPSLQTGGRIVQTGVAKVDRGEMVADPDRLVSDLADAINQTGGGGGGSADVDTSTLESQLNNVERELRRLQNALDITVEIGEETVARAAAQGKRDRISDSNPMT